MCRLEMKGDHPFPTLGVVYRSGKSSDSEVRVIGDIAYVAKKHDFDPTQRYYQSLQPVQIIGDTAEGTWWYLQESRDESGEVGMTRFHNHVFVSDKAGLHSVADLSGYWGGDGGEIWSGEYSFSMSSGIAHAIDLESSENIVSSTIMRRDKKWIDYRLSVSGPVAISTKTESTFFAHSADGREVPAEVRLHGSICEDPGMTRCHAAPDAKVRIVSQGRVTKKINGGYIPQAYFEIIGEQDGALRGFVNQRSLDLREP